MTHSIALVGAPHDANSSFLRGAAEAPDAIRRVLHNGAANLTSESGVDLAADGVMIDVGDFELPDGHDGILQIVPQMTKIIAQGYRVLTLGGDHAVTWPILQAVHAAHGPVTIVHFDAHADMYENFDNNPFSHASPFARIMEGSLASRLVQIGIRTLTTHQREMIARHGVETHQWRDSIAQGIPKLTFNGPIYISVDIDAIDPAFAPGVSHHEPGGMSVRDVITAIASIKGDVVGADIVEYNPSRDWQDMTAMVCAKLLKELAGKMREKQPSK